MSFSRRTRSECDELIFRFRLHDRQPVRLEPLLRFYHLRLLPRALPVEIDTVLVDCFEPGYVVLNAALSLEERRRALAHALGHCIAGHANFHPICLHNGWRTAALCREAEEAAAYLLLPANGYSLDEVGVEIEAMLCQVPLSLVQLRHGCPSNVNLCEKGMVS